MNGVSDSVPASSFGHLIDPTRTWYNNRRLIALNAWISLFLITSCTTGYDGSMTNGFQSLTQWESDFDYPSDSKLGLLASIQGIGWLAGLPFASYTSDSLGRRRTIWFGAAVMCIAAAIQTASDSVGMFMGARFLIGFGNSFAANAAPLLITELSYPMYRAPLTSLNNSLWYLGAVIAAWTTFGSFGINGTWAWRLPSLIQALPSTIQVLLVLFAPESPRWLVSKGHEAEALRILAYYHADGDEQDPMVQFEFNEIKAALEFDQTTASNISWKSFIATPGNRKRVRIIVALGFFSQWSGMALVSFYLPKILNQLGIVSSSTQLLINGVLQISTFFGALYASYTVNHHGRRFLFLTSTGLMIVFYTAQTICAAVYAEYGTVAAGHAAIAFVFLYALAYALAFNPLVVTYTVEILPFNLRAKGLCIFLFTLVAALVFNLYVNPIALEALGWKYYLVYVCWLVCEFIFLWAFLVETKGRTLEETAALFDGGDALDQIMQGAAVPVVLNDAYEKGPFSEDA